MRPGAAADAGGPMSYGDDIIMSKGFEPDEDDELDTTAYESQFRKDDESGEADDQPEDC